MTESAQNDTARAPEHGPKHGVDKQSPPTEGKPAKKEDSFFIFLIKLIIIVFIFRSFIFSPFSIPSESMLPQLQKGDYLLAAKWPYGYSRYSMPFGAPLIPGRIFASAPERGDVVIFKHPVDGVDYVKRVIGLPGDQIALKDGQVILNGKPVTRRRIGAFTIALSANTACHQLAHKVTMENGAYGCRYHQFEEQLPNGRRYDVLDLGETPQDNFAPITVPDASMFVMGDNRDNSQDSRFQASAGGGVGIVPQDLLVGRARVIVWSTDGSSQWLYPWTWFTALRSDRVGTGL